MRPFRCLLTAAMAALLPLAAQAQPGYAPTYAPQAQPGYAPTYTPQTQPHYAPTYAPQAQSMAAPSYPVSGMSGCSTCSGRGHASSCGASCQSCGKHGGWSFGSRLRALLGYKDCGQCPGGCHACKNNCSPPLYLFFIRDCAYRPSSCCGQGGCGEHTVNPPYAKSVFPLGHMIGAQPMGLPGGCGMGGCR